MKIFKVKRLDVWDYDDYSDFICFANSEHEARYMHPSNADGDGYYKWSDELKGWTSSYREDNVKMNYHGWVDNPEELKVTELNPANAFKPEIVCASFHAG